MQCRFHDFRLGMITTMYPRGAVHSLDWWLEPGATRGADGVGAESRQPSSEGGGGVRGEVRDPQGVAVQRCLEPAEGLQADLRVREPADDAVFEPAAGQAAGPQQRHRGLWTRLNNTEYFPSNFEGLVLGCIDADFCK